MPLDNDCCVIDRNYFAFVYRESSSKCVCHVFAELEVSKLQCHWLTYNWWIILQVDAATIVCAIQKTIMPLNASS